MQAREDIMSNRFAQQRKYRKALETVVYLANKDRRQYWVLKAIYLADKEQGYSDIADDVLPAVEF